MLLKPKKMLSSAKETLIHMLCIVHVPPENK